MSPSKIIAGLMCCTAGIFLAGCFDSPVKPETPEIPAVTSSADSLMTVLVNRMSDSNVMAIDAASIHAGFTTLVNQQPNNPQANIGFMASALLALNSNPKMKKMVDSLDAYLSYGNGSSDTLFLQKTFAAEGVVGLGKALAAKSAAILAAQTQEPSFPSFITLQYIQQVAEEDVMPVLDKIIAAAERLENRSEMSIVMSIEDSDSFEIDKGEIYAADAMYHLVRAYIGMFCTYNCDLYTSAAQQNYSWIDSLREMPNSDLNRYDFTLSNDTLYTNRVSDNAEIPVFMAKVLQYNLSRNGFLAIRKNNHAKVKADLLAVTNCIKSGISYIRNENDTQENDLIKTTYLTDADKSLIDTKSAMIKNGITPALANNFSTPESIADFIKALLSGPYTFNETIDSVHVQLKVNFAAWFDNPVQDLKTLLPKYQWTDKATWTTHTENYPAVIDTPSQDVMSVAVQASDVFHFSPDAIDSVSVSQYDPRYSLYHLKNPVHVLVNTDSSFTFNNPLVFVDDQGNKLNIDAPDAFPYFTDYTFHGIFPDLTTRQKWIDLLNQ